MAFGHVVACTTSKNLFFVDFVLEKQSESGREYVLACVYYSPCGRGGGNLKVAKEYMKSVQEVCNAQMDFFPRMLALCVYDQSKAEAYFRGTSCNINGRRMLGRFRVGGRGKKVPKVYATDVTC